MQEIKSFSQCPAAGDLLKLLDVSSSETVLPTSYGKLQPPLGKHRLKVPFNVFVHNFSVNA